MLLGLHVQLIFLICYLCSDGYVDRTNANSGVMAFSLLSDITSKLSHTLAFEHQLEDRTGLSEFIDQGYRRTLGGIVIQAPWISIVAAVVLASLLGFPGLGGFVGHSLIIIGSFTVRPFTILVASGSLLLASYYLFMMYRHIF